ncbi:MAG: hypothetical protein QM612_02910, partial [Thermomonas sp.]|uniref:hypothetical protein n=1 Tax=Thermomonas sp. TaxID=1971895 RepID=UPI0039E384DF
GRQALPSDMGTVAPDWTFARHKHLHPDLPFLFDANPRTSVKNLFLSALFLSAPRLHPDPRHADTAATPSGAGPT